MSEFIRVEYNALTDEDLAGIMRVCKLNPLGANASDVVRKIAGQNLSFWRLRKDDADVRLILEIQVHPHGNELLIFGLFGRGLFRNVPECLAFCKLVANKYFCVRISGDVYSKGLAKLYETLGAKPVLTKYVMEA